MPVLKLDETFSTAYPGWPEVRLFSTFADKKSSSAVPMTINQMELFENDTRQTIVGLGEADEPASVCILMDTSGSMWDSRQAMLKVVRAFLDASNAEDEIAVLTFDRQVEVAQQFTKDHQRVMAALQPVQPFGGSALLDAVMIAASQAVPHGSNKLKAIVVVSDGSDNISRLHLNDLLRYLRYGDAPIVSAVILKTPDIKGPTQHADDDAKRHLESITRETGGLTVLAETWALASAGSTVANDLRSRRAVLYRSEHAEADGKFRKIELRVRAASGSSMPKVCVRQGFYAPAK